MEVITHLDLFSGIGGFAYAIDQVWDNVEHIFCEINPFCQQIIKKNFGKDVVIYGDIRKLTSDTASGLRCSKQREQSKERAQMYERSDEVRIGILTGGFPCQPFSQAGKRGGTADNRYLWPEMFRVIRDYKPTWVIAENVRGILTIESGMVFEQVCLDLEACGYEVQTFIIPAVAVNAPHKRDRVWIIGHNDKYWHKRTKQEIQTREQSSITPRDNIYVTDTAKKRLQRGKQTDDKERQESNDKQLYGCNREWSQNWLEVATEFCGMDDGLPVELDGFKLTKAGHRVERLKALGNSIVPQAAIEILKGINLGGEH